MLPIPAITRSVLGLSEAQFPRGFTVTAPRPCSTAMISRCRTRCDPGLIFGDGGPSLAAESARIRNDHGEQVGQVR